MLTGVAPFAADQPGVLARMHLSAPAPDPCDRVKLLPRAVGKCVKQALEKNPEKRPASAGALYEALEKAWTDKPRSSRGRFFAASALALGVTVLVLVGAWLQRARSPATTSPVTVVAPTVAPLSVPPVPTPPPAETVPVAPAPAPSASARALTSGPSASKPSAQRPRARREAKRANATSTGTLSVVTLSDGRPTWANLTVDGNARGTTPLSFPLPTGVRKVRVERPGFRTVDVSASVTEGRTTILRVELHR
jgi:cytoskeletal protein RodZ